MNTETAQLHQEALERQIWFAFWVTHRNAMNCLANKQMLDDWMTVNLRSLSAESLDDAYAATEKQLAKRNLSARSQQVTQTVEPAEPIPAVDVENGPDADIPAQYTRKAILQMDRLEYRKLLAKYGDLAIQHRVNKVQKEDQ